ncbi:hypothetical protein CTV98_019425 [Bacillus altitudinis]|nr:hypothetical protein CTV98_019425 [Bacillus altitudinis]
MSPLDLLDTPGLPLDQMLQSLLTQRLLGLVDLPGRLDPLGLLDPLDPPDLLGLSFLFPLAVLE